MKPPILQNLAHRGTVLAEGFLFSARLLTEREMRRRVLALWQPGARVCRRGADLILLLAGVRVDCRRAPGAPLVRYGDILSAFPLEKNDSEYFETTGETLVFLSEGKLESAALRDLKAEAVEAWLDVSAFEAVETETLGEVFVKPVVIEKTESIDLREALAEVPAADREMAEVLEVLRRKKEEIEKSRGGASTRAGGASESSIGKGLGGFFDSFMRMFSSAASESLRHALPADEPNSPGKLRRAFNRLLFQTKIAQILGRKQAEYLAKMTEMFENGDLEQALKHAIPLEEMQALQKMTEQTPFLGFLRPRDNLRISYERQASSGSSLFLEDNWFEHLRQLYRQTFDRLVAQNRIEEAAFVLAELLKSNAEAVEFLEKHGKFRLAAELAEARDLPKETIVRQWFLAGERRRAVQLAILHNCFEFVVSRLEQQNHPQAAELREIWARALASKGNFAAAVNTLWRVEARRDVTTDWIERAIEFGGAPAAEMLAKKLALMPESFDDVKAKLLEILADDETEGAENRAAFAREALRLAPSRELRTLARPLARQILADLADGRRHLPPKDFQSLVEIAQDYAFRTDLPKLPPAADEKTSEEFNLTVTSRDRGASHIADAHLLPDGKIAVALGEAGVKILSKSGKTIAHYDQPTYKFVVSDSGTKAICLAPRGATYRLAQIDFASRRARYWCEAAFSAYAPTFDGYLWFIATRDEVFAVDTHAAGFESVWRVPEIGGEIIELALSKGKLTLLVFNDRGIEKWWYDLPQMILRSRNEPKWLAMENERQAMHSVSSFVAYSVVQTLELTEDERSKFQARIYDYDTKIAQIKFADETRGVHKPQIVEKIFAITSFTERAFVVRLYEVPNRQIAKFVISRQDSENFNVRLDENSLVVTDEAGRVLIFDYKERLLRRNLRL